jgi:Bacterial type II/III secretion system short domain
MRSISSTKLLLLSGLAVGILTAFFLSREVLAQNPLPVPKEPAKADVSYQKTKVFRLTRTDPEEVKQVMATLLDYIPVPQAAAPQPISPMGVGMLGMGGGLPSGPTPFSIAHDPRTKSVVVRGSDKHLAMAADFVAVVDGPIGKEPAEAKTLRAVTLKNAKPEEIAQVIEALELDARLVALTAAKMVVFTGSEQTMKDIAALVKELDVPADPEPKKEEKRKLLNDPDGQ